MTDCLSGNMAYSCCVHKAVNQNQTEFLFLLKRTPNPHVCDFLFPKQTADPKYKAMNSLLSPVNKGHPHFLSKSLNVYFSDHANVACCLNGKLSDTTFS